MIILNLDKRQVHFVCLRGAVSLSFCCDYLLKDIIRLSKMILR